MCYSCDGAELIEQWSGDTVLEGCCFGYLVSLVGLVCSIVLNRFNLICEICEICETIIIWVPPEVTFAVFVILITFLFLDAFGFYGLCVQAAESFAEDVGRYLMR